MIPNIDILFDFSRLQRKIKELEESNVQLANKIVSLRTEIEKLQEILDKKHE